MSPKIYCSSFGKQLICTSRLLLTIVLDGQNLTGYLFVVLTDEIQLQHNFAEIQSQGKSFPGESNAAVCFLQCSLKKKSFFKLQILKFLSTHIFYTLRSVMVVEEYSFKRTKNEKNSTRGDERNICVFSRWVEPTPGHTPASSPSLTTYHDSPFPTRQDENSQILTFTRHCPKSFYPLTTFEINMSRRATPQHLL